MLTDADARIVDRDPRLPALRFLLDMELACAWLQEQLPELQVTGVRCDYLRYKPATSCLATWQVSTAAGPLVFFAKTFSDDNAAKFSKAVSHACGRVSGRSEVAIDAVRLLIAAPSHYDHRLPGFDSFSGATGYQGLIERLVPNLFNLHRAQVVSLRYKPERRFVARLDVEGSPAAALKIYSDSRYRQARRAMKSLGTLQAFPTAAPLGHSDRHQALLVEWLAGNSLATLISDKRVAADHFASAGAVLAQFHQLETGKLPHRSVEYELHQISQQAADARLLDADLEDRLQRVIVRSCQLLGNRQLQLVPTHGDFHPGQVLWTENATSLIDLDDVALGDPAYDLASFLAAVEYASQSSTLTLDEIQSYQAALLESYQHVRGVRLDLDQLQVFVASALVRLVHEPFRHRLPDWQARQHAIVARTEQLLAGDSTSSRPTHAPSRARSTSVVVEDSFEAKSDPALPNLAAALDPEQAHRQVVALARETYGDAALSLRRIRVLRHKPGRRCLIAYDLETATGEPGLTLLGKVHSKRRHESSFQLQLALWNAGFDNQSDDGISVARPIGVVPEWHMWLQEFVPGTDGWTALRVSQPSLVTARISQAVDKLHHSELLVSRTHTLEDELSILEDRLPRVGEAMPHLRSRVEMLLQKCRDLTRSCHSHEHTTIHRDFYPDQILLQGKRLFVLDHDLVCLGPRSLDIGNFCAHLIEHALRNPQDHKTCAKCEAAIVKNHLLAVGKQHRQEIYDLTTLSLARHVHISTCFVDRQFATARILEACLERLASSNVCCSTPPVFGG